MSDSLSWLDGGSGDGAFAGAVWRPPPGKRGAFLHARLVETGGRGVRVRRLGASRAGEIRLTRFLRNPAVTVEEMAAEAAARTAGRQARPHRHAPGLARVPSRQTRRRPHRPATQCVNLLAPQGGRGNALLIVPALPF